jgi:hypothetical protein
MQSRREGAWLTASQVLPPGAVVDSLRAARASHQPALPLDDRPVQSTGAGAVRTIVLLI